MNRKLLLIFLGLIFLTASGVMAQWDNHKMHYPQLPDESGWGITSRPNKILADDWQCSESGPVRDLHVWAKWFGGIEGTIDHFDILIYADIPADPPSVPFSRPGALLWQGVASEFTMTRFARTSPGGWYNPSTGEALSDVQQDYFQYDIFFDDPQTWFEQVEGTIYWIQIAPVLTSGGEWGWMSSLDNWNDNAIYWNTTTQEWIELYEPGSSNPLDLSFVITADANATYEGACCYPEPTGSGDMLCMVTSLAECEDNLLGTYRGNATSCQPMEACCFDDGSCLELDLLCCVDMGGEPQGPGTDCASAQCASPCDCVPGEADGNPLITILDVVYIINHKYKDGPDPLPYALCSADADGNCLVSILDVVYIINYKYKNGPHPITCGNFIANCPGGLR